MNFKIFNESSGNAGDHVIDDTANRAVKGALFALLGRTGDDNGAAFGFK